MYNATLRQDSLQNGDIFSFSLRLSQILHRNLEHLLWLNSSGGSERTHDSMFHFMASEIDHCICCWIDISHSSPSFLPHNYALRTDTNPYAFSSYTDRRRKLWIGGHPAELITAALSLCCHGHVMHSGFSPTGGLALRGTPAVDLGPTQTPAVNFCRITVVLGSVADLHLL